MGQTQNFRRLNLSQMASLYDFANFCGQLGFDAHFIGVGRREVFVDVAAAFFDFNHDLILLRGLASGSVGARLAGEGVLKIVFASKLGSYEKRHTPARP